MPENYARYLCIVNSVLAGEFATTPCRKAGQRCVYERHLYERRELTTLESRGPRLPHTASISTSPNDDDQRGPR